VSKDPVEFAILKIEREIKSAASAAPFLFVALASARQAYQGMASAMRQEHKSQESPMRRNHLKLCSCAATAAFVLLPGPVGTPEGHALTPAARRDDNEVQ
jgi:hypothetical protein